MYPSECNEEDHHYHFFFSSRRRHTMLTCDWSSDVCSSDLGPHRRLGGVSDLFLQLGDAGLRLMQAEVLDQHGLHQVIGQIGRASCRERVKKTTIASINRQTIKI